MYNVGIYPSFIYIYVHCTSSINAHLFSFTAEEPSYRLTDRIISLPIRCLFIYFLFLSYIIHLSHLSVGNVLLLVKSVGLEFKSRSSQSLGFHIICFCTVGLSRFMFSFTCYSFIFLLVSLLQPSSSELDSPRIPRIFV